MVYPPFRRAAAEFMKLVEAAPADANKRVWIEGQNMDGKDVRKGVLLPLGDAGTARERLRKHRPDRGAAGRRDADRAGAVWLQGREAGHRTGLQDRRHRDAADRPSKEWVFIPALALLGVSWRCNWRASGAPPCRAEPATA
jgi:hypothetical protein